MVETKGLCNKVYCRAGPREYIGLSSLRLFHTDEMFLPLRKEGRPITICSLLNTQRFRRSVWRHS